MKMYISTYLRQTVLLITTLVSLGKINAQALDSVLTRQSVDTSSNMMNMGRCL